MEFQRILNSQNNLEKEKLGWKSHAFLAQNLLHKATITKTVW